MKKPFFNRSQNSAGVLLALLFSLLAQSAHAHVQDGAVIGFSSGFSHPWSGWDHILAMIAVGLWGAQLGIPAVWMLPVAFPMLMAFGAFLGLVGVPLPGIELGIALSALLLGLLVSLEARLPLTVATGIVGVFGLFHGHAHGTELPPGASGLLYSMGFVIATGCLHGLGIGIGLIHRWSAGKFTIRFAGLAIAIMGAWFTWEALK